jgi:hypothetical protein
MRMRWSRPCRGGQATVLLVAALGAALCAVAPRTQAQHFYRWVDDQGNVQYTDKIPPSEIEKARTELSPDGMRVTEVPPAKTPEEIQRERELERLRAQQQRLIEEQKAEDRVLLRTFRSLDDMIMVRDGKISAIDVMIQVTKSNIQRQRDWLLQLRAEAADLERAGEPVTEQLEGRIASTERALKQALATILEREQQKQEIRDNFARDMKRFRQLNEIPEEPSRVEQVTQPTELGNLINCKDERECARVWAEALDYVELHATVPVETAGADVLMTKAPDSNKDIALTLTRIWNTDRKGAVIFLDLQCKSYSARRPAKPDPGSKSSTHFARRSRAARCNPPPSASASPPVASKQTTRRQLYDDET